MKLEDDTYDLIHDGCQFRIRPISCIKTIPAPISSNAVFGCPVSAMSPLTLTSNTYLSSIQSSATLYC